MNRFFAVYLCLLPLVVCADDKPKAEGKNETATHTGRTKSCNEEANDKNLKGEDRKTFMRTCLAKPVQSPTY